MSKYGVYVTNINGEYFIIPADQICFIMKYKTYTLIYSISHGAILARNKFEDIIESYQYALSNGR